MHILQNDTVQEFEILYDLKMKTVLQNHRRFLQGVQLALASLHLNKQMKWLKLQMGLS